MESLTYPLPLPTLMPGPEEEQPPNDEEEQGAEPGDEEEPIRGRPVDDADIPSLTEPPEEEGGDAEKDWEVVKDADNYTEYRHKTTGEPRLKCKHCNFETPGTGRMGVHLNPRTKFYCPTLAKNQPQAKPTAASPGQPSAAQPKSLPNIIRRPRAPTQIRMPQEEAPEEEGDELLKQKPDPVRILFRILDKFPDMTPKHKEWVIAMCSEAGEGLDASTIFKHLMATRGVKEATARYIAELFTSAFNKEMNEFQESQMAQGYSSSQGGRFGMRPPPGWGQQPDQYGQYQTQGYPPPQGRYQRPPYGSPYPPNPYDPYGGYPFPQQQQPDREMMQMRSEIRESSRSMERAVTEMARALAESKREPPKDDFKEKLLFDLLKERQGGTKEDPVVKRLEEANKALLQRLDAKEFQTMRQDLLGKIEQIEKRGSNANQDEIKGLAAMVQGLSERTGGQLSDEARVALSEITNASAERRQLYSETRHLIDKAADIYAAKEGVRLTDREVEKASKADSQFTDEELDALDKEIDEEKAKRGRKKGK